MIGDRDRQQDCGKTQNLSLTTPRWKSQQTTSVSIPYNPLSSPQKRGKQKIPSFPFHPVHPVSLSFCTCPDFALTLPARETTLGVLVTVNLDMFGPLPKGVRP